MTPDEVAAALAARTPGPWWTQGRTELGWVAGPDGDVVATTNGNLALGGEPWENARAIAIAVNLADDLWRVSEAARAHTDAECSCLAVNWTHDDDCALVTTEAALREALAALAATREETK